MMFIRRIRILCLLVFILVFTDASDKSEKGVKCYKDESLGERPVNVYYCPDPDKPRCCQPEGGVEHTCCETKASEDFKSQLKIWLYIFLGVAILVVVCLYWFKDVNYCTLKKPLKDYISSSSSQSKKNEIYFDNPAFHENIQSEKYRY